MILSFMALPTQIGPPLLLTVIIELFRIVSSIRFWYCLFTVIPFLPQTLSLIQAWDWQALTVGILYT